MVALGATSFSPGELYGIQVRRESEGERLFLISVAVIATATASFHPIWLSVLAIVCLIGCVFRTRLRSSRWVVGQVEGGREKYLFRVDSLSEAEGLARRIEDAMRKPRSP